VFSEIANYSFMLFQLLRHHHQKPFSPKVSIEVAKSILEFLEAALLLNFSSIRITKTIDTNI